MFPTSAQLYLCTDARSDQGDFEDFVDAAFAGGVDIIQLRDKNLEAAAELEALSILSEVASRYGAVWAVNDRADIAAVAKAPILHVGQGDLAPVQARQVLGPTASIGLSTHAKEEIVSARANPGLAYFCVGPVWPTPTKPGRVGVGLDLVHYAAETEARVEGEKPWFAIGGIDMGTVDEVVDAGAKRIVVVRAITHASDPTQAAQKLRQALPPLEHARR